MLVLHTIARHYKKLDQPVSKSRASSRHADSKSDLRSKAGDSARDHQSSGAALHEEVEHQILNKEKIQKFIYDYILEKLKTEKLPI